MNNNQITKLSRDEPTYYTILTSPLPKHTWYFGPIQKNVNPAMAHSLS